jgi:hypothetical protein
VKEFREKINLPCNSTSLVKSLHPKAVIYPLCPHLIEKAKNPEEPLSATVAEKERNSAGVALVAFRFVGFAS